MTSKRSANGTDLPSHGYNLPCPPPPAYPTYTALCMIYTIPIIILECACVCVCWVCVHVHLFLVLSTSTEDESLKKQKKIPIKELTTQVTATMLAGTQTATDELSPHVDSSGLSPLPVSAGCAISPPDLHPTSRISEVKVPQGNRGRTARV